MTLGAPVASARPANPSAAEAVRWTSSWPTLAAWGAGLILVALGAGALTGDSGSAWTVTTGTVLVLLGLTALAWGTFVLARGRLVLPRVVVAASLFAVVALVAAMTADPSHVSVIAVAAASLLLVLLGAGCGLRLRRGRQATVASTRPSIIGMLIGALLVGALVTPALGATEAGRLAPDHSSHDIVVDQHPH